MHRIDAACYMTDVLNSFDGMAPAEARPVGLECTILGRRGPDLSRSQPKYTLRTLPAEFSALAVVLFIVPGSVCSRPGPT